MAVSNLWKQCRVALLSALSAASLGGQALAQAYSQVVVFGDSNEDSGYYRQLSSPGGGATYNSYWAAAVAAGGGTPTSRPGTTTSEWIAGFFGHTLTPANLSGGTNYATSGAKNAATNSSVNGGFSQAIPTVTQIANYLASVGNVANPTALYLIHSGDNDVTFAAGNSGAGPFPADPNAYLTSAAQSLATAINSLRTAGATKFLVITLNSSFPTGNATIQGYRTTYNNALIAALNSAGVTYVQSTFNQTQLAIVANPAAFGLTTASNAAANTACTVPSGVTTAWGLLCATGAGAPSTFVTPTADMTRLFADDSHYATHGQKLRANTFYAALPAATTSQLYAAVAPSSRSVQVGSAVTAYATILNATGTTQTGCRVLPVTNVNARYLYQTTNPATNTLTGTPNTPATIPPNSGQTFLVAFPPTTGVQGVTDVKFAFVCAGMPSAVPIVGLNTLQVVIDANPVPDIISIAATPTNDGIMNIPGTTGTGFFAAAGVDIGAAGSITVTADDNGRGLPIAISLCQTNSVGGCINPSSPGASVVYTAATNQTATFTIYARGTANVPFDPANNRVFLRFKTADGVTRGSTSVAVRTN